jgi:cation diffusion facilitator family transporter
MQVSEHSSQRPGQRTLAGRSAKQLAALGSIGSAVVLVLIKVVLTVATHSLGVLSEALHSSLDLIAAILTYLSVRVSDLPADAGHPYGHGKVESFSAFAETGLLLITALYIIWEAFRRLFFYQVEIEPSWFAIGALLVAVLVDVVRSRVLARVARQYQSEALEADALHFSTDVWSTLAVIFGIAAVWLGRRTGVGWLRYADPVAALVVAAVVIWVGSQLGKRTMDALLDAAPKGLQERLARAIEEVDGVLGADRLRVRRVGNRYFVDVTISVSRTATFERVHAISYAVEQRVADIVPADVVVHMEPRALIGEHLFDSIRAAAEQRGLAVHELAAHQLDGRLAVDLHLEVDEHSTLREAHRRASELEEAIRHLPAVESRGRASQEAQVNVHIEPLGTHIAAADSRAGEMKTLGRAVEEYINSLVREFHELVDCHEVHVYRVENKILAACHCAMDGDLPITDIHDVTVALEDRVKEHFPQIFRVNIHPEPVEER